jgi:hypothetical protein
MALIKFNISDTGEQTVNISEDYVSEVKNSHVLGYTHPSSENSESEGRREPPSAAPITWGNAFDGVKDPVG